MREQRGHGPDQDPVPGPAPRRPRSQTAWAAVRPSAALPTTLPLARCPGVPTQPLPLTGPVDAVLARHRRRVAPARARLRRCWRPRSNRSASPCPRRRTRNPTGPSVAAGPAWPRTRSRRPGPGEARRLLAAPLPRVLAGLLSPSKMPLGSRSRGMHRPLAFSRQQGMTDRAPIVQRRTTRDPSNGGE